MNHIQLFVRFFSLGNPHWSPSACLRVSLDALLATLQHLGTFKCDVTGTEMILAEYLPSLRIYITHAHTHYMCVCVCVCRNPVGGGICQGKQKTFQSSCAITPLPWKFIHTSNDVSPLPHFVLGKKKKRAKQKKRRNSPSEMCPCWRWPG